MAEFFWLLTVSGGAVVLAACFAYVLLKRRRLTPSERAAQKEATEEVYRHRG